MNSLDGHQSRKMKMEPNEILLNDATSNLFERAEKIISDYEDFIYSCTGRDTATAEFEMEHDEFLDSMEWVNLSLFSHIAALAEKIGLSDHAKVIRENLQKIRDDELLIIGLDEKVRLNDIQRHDRAEVFFSPALQHLRLLYAPIASLMSVEVNSSMDVLERILKKAPEIIFNKFGTKGASKEKDVEDALYEICLLYTSPSPRD